MSDDPARQELPAWLETLSELSATWRDPEFWKDEGCRMDSTDCADALDKALADLRAAWQQQLAHVPAVENALSSLMSAGLILTLKAECEAQFARAEKAERERDEARAATAPES